MCRERGIWSISREELKAQRSGLGLSEPRQQGAVELDIKIFQVEDLSGANRIESPGARLQQRWLAAELQRQIKERGSALVDDRKLVQHGHRILEVGEVELGDCTDSKAWRRRFTRIHALRSCRLSGFSLALRLL
jgi:hypothetical protein